jgi:hypothetical protein
MITLLASITGFLTSLIPEIIQFLKEKSDKNHEIEMLNKQFRFSKIGKEQDLEEMQIRQQASEHSAIYSTYTVGVSWVDALNGTVRPVLAYSFFLIYSAVKFTQYHYLKDIFMLAQNIEMIWTVDDQAIFASIIGFYFGQRTFAKPGYNKIKCK